MTLRRNFLVLMTTAVALAAGCGARAYMPVSSMPVGVSQAQLGGVDAMGRPKPAPSKGPRELHFTTMSGVVTQILPDDTVGLPHQHFLYRGAHDNKIYKVAHNTKLAPKVPVRVGDKVSFKGELIESSPYDVMHWTHWNPQGGEGGWIEHNGKRYEKIPGSK